MVIRDRQGKERPLSFQHNLRQLIGRDAIPETDVKLWMQAGELRDWAALPEHHDSVGPDLAVIALTRAAGMIGRLFASAPTPTETKT